MPKNELKKLYDVVKNPGTRLIINSKIIKDFKPILNRFDEVDNQERPDGLILVGDTVYMLEHFQVSMYLDKKGNDLLKQAQGNTFKRQLKKDSDCMKFEDKYLLFDKETLLPDIFNLLRSFNTSLTKHMSNYDKYLENAQSKFPNKMYKFILVIEDNSDAIILKNDDWNSSLCLLDYREIVEQILEYQQIDGVIVFDSDTRGKHITAKDKECLQNSELCEMDLCELVVNYVCMYFSREQQENILRKLQTVLRIKDDFGIVENVSVEKNSKKRSTD